MMKKILVSVVAFGIVIASYSQRRISTIESFDYIKRKKITVYTIFPYGTVSLPGKWKKGKQYGWQQYAYNDSIGEIAIIMAPNDKINFNHDGAKKNYEFAKAYYEWESNYFKDTVGVHTELIEKDSINNFIIFRIWLDEKNINTIMLVGGKEKLARNIAFYSSKYLSQSEKILFLKKLYYNSFGE